MAVIIWYTVCLSNAPSPLPSIRHLPLRSAHVTHLTAPTNFSFFCFFFLSPSWAGYGWPQSAAPRTRKTKPVTACLFFLPHQQHPTPTHPHQNYHHQTSAIHTVPCRHIYCATHNPRPHSYMPTPHTLPHHKHTWPTSFPVRHESDSCSAFTGVIHGY